LIPLVSAGLIVFPLTFVSGYAFPLACLLHVRAQGAISRSTGRVLLVNTLGGMAGPIITAFLLIPWRGAALSVLFHLVPLLLVAFVLAEKASRRWIGTAAALVLAVVLLAPAPRILPPSFAR
jgi:spermidine synthase